MRAAAVWLADAVGAAIGDTDGEIDHLLCQRIEAAGCHDVQCEAFHEACAPACTAIVRRGISRNLCHVGNVAIVDGAQLRAKSSAYSNRVTACSWYLLDVRRSLRESIW